MAIPTDKPITGIPDPTEFGDISGIPKGQVLPLVIQRHEARKAGLHRDIRFGKDKMFSWATKKPGLPLPGEMQALYQTPLHEESYMHYSGELPRGMYGAGSVTPQEKGSVVVHSATPDKVVFTTGHSRNPQTFVMIRTGTKPTDWIVRNLNPKSLEDFAGPGVDYAKQHYKTAPSEDIEKLYSPEATFSEKIDGARMLLRLKAHHVEAASYRPSVTGHPIMHTARLQLPRGLKIPAKLLGTTLVGESYGERIPEKSGAYHGSRALKKLLDKIRGPVAPDTEQPQTGRTDSGMVTGSDAPRLEQGLKMGGIMAPLAVELAEQSPRFLRWFRSTPEKKEESAPVPAVKHPLPLVHAEHDRVLQTEATPAAETKGSAEVKTATINGEWVEPPVAKSTLYIKGKVKPMKPDTRKLLQDKVAAVDVTFGFDTRRMTDSEYIQAIKDGKLKGTYTMKPVKSEKQADAIPVQELGGILNASLAESLRKQRDQKVQMRTAIFNILSQGKKPVGPEVPYPERLKMIQEVLGHLPEQQFHLPEMATTPESQRALFEAIQAGKNPRTSEGVVVWPETGVPTKVKLMPESDVTVRSVFPGEGKYEGSAGGFEYSLPGSEKVVGKVGTGLSDELRQLMMQRQQDYVGRIARVRSMGQYPSGAHRAPALIAMHEG